MFKCKCCPEKDARIADLKEQIAYLRTMLYQPSPVQALVNQEASNILDGAANTIEPEPQEPVVLTADDKELLEIVPLYVPSENRKYGG